MKKIIIGALLFVLLPACKKEIVSEPKAIASNVAVERFKEYYGIWTGDFEPVYEENDTIEVEYRKISIKINRIIGDDVYGQSIVAGVQRPLKGKIAVQANDIITLTLDEPGTDKYDGRFQLELVAGTSLQGSHIAFKTNPETTKIKKLKLTHKEFVYNPHYMLSEDIEGIDWDSAKEQQVVYEEYYDEEYGDSIMVAREVNDSTNIEGKEVVLEEVYRVASDQIYRINASTSRLTEEELKNLRKLDLEIIRNSIYARHGYSFKKGSIRHFFEVSDWYVPVSNYVDNELTQLEKDNIVLLKRLEKYAEDHYDTFGR